MQYDLYVEINASDEQVREYIDLVLGELEKQCPNHTHKFQINPPRPIAP